MADILFYCPHCSQQLEAGDSMMGLGLECPSCHQSLIIPKVAVHPDPEGDQVNFDCPHCAQNIDAPAKAVGVAIACPHCAQSLTIPGLVAEESVPIGGPAQPEPSVEEGVEEEKKGATARIEVPPTDGIPDRQIRMVTIRRPTGTQSGAVPRTPAPGAPPPGPAPKRKGLFGFFGRG